MQTTPAPLAQLQQQEAALAAAVRQTAQAVRQMGSPVEAAMADLRDAIADRRAALAAHMADFAGELLALAADYGAAALAVAGPLEPEADMRRLVESRPGIALSPVVDPTTEQTDGSVIPTREELEAEGDDWREEMKAADDERERDCRPAPLPPGDPRGIDLSDPADDLPTGPLPLTDHGDHPSAGEKAWIDSVEAAAQAPEVQAAANPPADPGPLTQAALEAARKPATRRRGRK